jgi:cytochrome c-type biogenesis protein CcmH/NrfF
MKRLTFLWSLLLLFLFIGHSFAYTPQIGRMRVSIWPEFDDPGVLVIYDGRFVDEGSFPLETTFLIPKGAVISDACSLSPKGQHFCQLFTQKSAGDMDEVNLKLPYPNFYLSFHIKPFKGDSPLRKLNYTIKTSHPVSKLEVDIQKPLRAEDFTINPAAEEKEELKGFEHFRYAFKDREAGAVFPFEISYKKEDNRPSVSIKYSPMKGAKTWVEEDFSRINEIARELACPCECPLVLEDCNMSCGLDWKDQIGEMLRQGKTKEEIIAAFVGKYGDACKITPMQRIHGKFYQYTRRFDTMDWALLWSGVAAVAGGVFLGIYMGVRRFMREKSKGADA